MKATFPANEAQRPAVSQGNAAGEGILEKNIRIAFIASALLLIFASGLSVNSLIEYGAHSNKVGHTLDVIKQAERVLLDMIEAQAGVRGYIITGDERFMEPYLTSQKDVAGDVQKLRMLTADNPGQQRRMDELEPLIAKRLNYANEQVELRKKQGYLAAQKTVALGTAKALTDQIRTLLADFVETEQLLLSERNRQAKSGGLYAIAIIAGSGVLALAILLLAALRLRRDIALRKQAEKERNRLFNYALDLYCIAGFDGYFKQLNPAWEKTLGWSNTELLARPYLELVHPDDRESTIHAAGTLVDGKEVFKFDNRYLCKDGSYKWISWVSHPRMEEGLIFAVARDITESKRASIQLRETLELQRAILDNAGHAVISTTPDGIITTFNPAAEKMLGYAAAEVVGLRTPAIIHDPAEVTARAQEFSDELGEAIAPGFEVFVARARRNLPNEYEWTYIRKDGTRFPVLLSVTALRDAAGAITGFLGMAIDLSERKLEQDRFRLVIEASPSGLVMVNEAGVITLVNAQTEKLFGYAREALVGQPVEMLIPERFRAAHPGLRHSFLADPKVRAMGAGRDLYGRRKDGSEFPLEVGLSPLATPEGVVVLAAMVDITVRKQSEKLLLARNEELKRFTYTVSHDLKAPLRGIAGYAQELERRHKEGLPERAQFCVAQIVTATRNLDSLIEDLLKYSRLDTETLTLTEVNLPDLVQSILLDRSLAITEQGVEVSVNIPPVILRSWERGLQQVLSNLIDNAIKYSRLSKPPRLTINAETTGGGCCITVTDNGIGFDMKYHDRIFGLFNRLVRADEFEGTGVGLAIVKKVVEKLGGSIRAESAPGQGAAFIVELPVLNEG